MKHYLINLGAGITRNIIAASPFDAIRTALDTLTLAEQVTITGAGIRISARPVART